MMCHYIYFKYYGYFVCKGEKHGAQNVFPDCRAIYTFCGKFQTLPGTLISQISLHKRLCNAVLAEYTNTGSHHLMGSIKQNRRVRNYIAVECDYINVECVLESAITTK